VFLAASQGDVFADGLVEDVARDLGLGIASLVHVFNPRKFVLGGGVSQNWPLLEPTVRATLDGVLMPGFAEHLEIEISQLGDDVGLVGAAAFAVSETSKAGKA
jgi:predicted NBD/HSP70 family sugar kinase